MPTIARPVGTLQSKRGREIADRALRSFRAFELELQHELQRTHSAQEALDLDQLYNVLCAFALDVARLLWGCPECGSLIGQEGHLESCHFFAGRRGG